MTDLIIVESPGKISKISQFAGKEYKVKASVGHCIDLPEKTLGVDLKDNFKPTYKTIQGKGPVLQDIKAAAKGADIVYLATDNDREGEAIAWLIANYLPKKTKIQRILFNEITKSAIQKALENPCELDENKFQAQQARRILDRLVGYRVSPILPKGLSAGRVQSVALRIIADRQRAIEAFVPKEYWTIHVDLETPKQEQFRARLEHKDDITNEEAAQEIVSYLEKQQCIVSDVIKKEKKERASAPFKTSSMQSTASAIIDFAPSRTMTVAQQLYESGHITYHRSDSISASTEAISSARSLIATEYGSSYVPATPIMYKMSAKKAKLAQGAHECIRPSNIDATVGSLHLTGDGAKLYDLIRRKFIASQMNPAIFDTVSVKIKAGKYDLAANGRVKKFDGYTKVWVYSKSIDVTLPNIEVNDVEKIIQIDPAQHFTKPPPKFHDASFIKELEDQGIGRPSTYATIIKTLLDRKYVEKDGKNLKPTEVGYSVCDFLVENFVNLMNVHFTSGMESDLDLIESGDKEWVSVLDLFWTDLKEQIAQAKENKKAAAMTEYECPDCGRFLQKRTSKWGDFYGCSGYNDKENKCKNIMNIGEDGSPVKKQQTKKEIMEGVTCPCGGEVIIRTNRKDGNKFGGCSKYPKCKNTFSLDGTMSKPKKKKAFKKNTKKKATKKKKK